MKWYDYFIRFFVGILFIFSGLTKLDDPVGTAIKLKEYFEVFAENFSGFFKIFIPIALPAAVLLILLELMLGFALILKYRIRLTAWLLLFLSLFFTFLTFYSAFFNKVTDCGCFGDAIPLTPWGSFYKDVVLLLLVVILFIRRNHFPSSALDKTAMEALIAGLFAVNLSIAVYTIYHLPFIDFRPYKTGNNIPSLMKPSAPFRYRYVMEKDGRQYTFDQFPADTTYSFKKMDLLNPEAQPKITDYHVWNDEGDFTQETFAGNKLFIIMYNINKANTKHFGEINRLAEDLAGKADVWILTASGKNEMDNLVRKYQLKMPYYYTDMTVLETIVRSNPGIWLLKDGTVKGKWAYTDIPDARVIERLLN